MKAITLSLFVALFSAATPAAPGFLGILLGDVDAESVEDLKLPAEFGALVNGVMEDSAAEAAELQELDVIVAINGQRVESASALQRMVGEIPAGRDIKLDLIRDGAREQVDVKLGLREEGPTYTRPDFRHFHPWSMPDPNGWRYRLEEGKVQDEIPIPPNPPRLGIMVQPVEAQLSSFLGIKSGLLVLEIDENSKGEAAGLKEKDIILNIGGESTSKASQITRALLLGDGEEIEMTILRSGKQLELRIEPVETEKQPDSDEEDDEIL